MRLRSTLVPFLLLLPALQQPPQPPQPPQPSQKTIRQHHEAAEARRRAGDFAGAEAEYAAILAEGYGKRGRVYARGLRYSDAAAALEAATGFRPDSAELLVDLSIAQFDAGEFTKAAASASRAAALDQRAAGARHMLGKARFMLGEFDAAAAALEEALRLAPRDYDVAYTLGLAHLKRKRLADARVIYERMLAQLGDRPQLRIIFGRAYRETGFLPEAVEEFKRAVALDPRTPRAHYYLGLTYLLKDGADRLDDAAAEFKIELASNPEEYFANYYLGVIYAMQRKWDEAAALLRKAAAREPDNPDPYFHLGQALQGLERHAEAVEVLKKSIALTRDLSHNEYQVTTAHYRLGQSLLKLGRQEEGERELQLSSELKSRSLARDKERAEAYLSPDSLKESPSKFPEFAAGIVADAAAPGERERAELAGGASYYEQVVAAAHNAVGLLRAEREDFRGAAAQFALASKWDPKLEGVDYNWGLAAYRAELYKEAVAPLERELAARPSNQQARQLLGMSYFVTENYARASELLARVAAERPDNVAVNYTLALALAKQGRKDEVARVMERMLAAGGNSPQLHIVLGQAYYEQGETEKALEELRAALALDARTPLAHYYAGLIHLKGGKFEEAAREFEAELALNPSDLQAKYHLGFVLLARQDAARGTAVMREVVAARPDFADARYELGKALLQQGDVKGAVENLEAAARLAPDKSHVRYQLGRALLAAGRKAEGDGQLEVYRQLKEKERAQTAP
jgi:tetratricopeptide (TPR) repeat protein